MRNRDILSLLREQREKKRRSREEEEQTWAHDQASRLAGSPMDSNKSRRGRVSGVCWSMLAKNWGCSLAQGEARIANTFLNLFWVPEKESRKGS